VIKLTPVKYIGGQIENGQTHEPTRSEKSPSVGAAEDKKSARMKREAAGYYDSSGTPPEQALSGGGHGWIDQQEARQRLKPTA